MTIEVWLARDAWEAIALCAAIDAGFGGDVDRVLLAASCVPIPEVEHWWHDAPPSAVTDRFRAVVDLNEVIAPFHPAHHAPGHADRLALAAAVQESTGMEGITALVVTSLDDAPATTLLDAFPTVAVRLLSTSAADWDPRAKAFPVPRAERVVEWGHVDLVPGREPNPRGLTLDGLSVPSEGVRILGRDIALGADPTGALASALISGTELAAASAAAHVSTAFDQDTASRRPTLEARVERLARAAWKRVNRWLK